MNVERRKRAQRFPLRLPLQYRLTGRSAWETATTENISDSGLLFGMPETPTIGDLMDMEIRMESDERQKWPSQVNATGSVVRLASIPLEANLRSVAVKFLKSKVVASLAAQA